MASPLRTLIAVFPLLALAACGQPNAPAAPPAADTATSVVTDTTAASTAALEPVKNPDTLVRVLPADQIRTLDPASAYDSGSGSVLYNIYEALVFRDSEKPGQFVPRLAAELPTVENGLLGDGGRTYAFPIREGIKFSAGPVNDASGSPIPGSGSLSPADVAYSFQRGMLQNRASGPQSLLLDPLLGVNSILQLAREIEAESTGKKADDIKSLDDVSPATLEATCQRVKAAVAVDGKNVVFHLKEPFAPFVNILAGYWASILDSEWVMAEVKDAAGKVAKRAGWDGSCATWRSFYDPKTEESELFATTNGTGPYVLKEWRREEEVILERNDDYWRERPAYLKQVVLKFVPEWSTRLLMLQVGDADLVDIPATNRDQVRPLVEQGVLQEIPNLPSASMSFFNMNELVAAENNPYIGSGKLDGAGIPPDFFADVEVRKGFAYAFDWETYIKDGLAGDARKAKSPIPSDVAGHDPSVANYALDPGQAGEHFAQAYGGKLGETGFALTLPLAPGDKVTQVAYEIYQKGLAQINPKFKLTIQEMQGTQLTKDNDADLIPFRRSSWGEDYHDPHNWVFPLLGRTGYYARLMNLPAATQTTLDELILKARREQDPEARIKLYQEIQRVSYDEALVIPLVEPIGRAFDRSWLHGIVHNPPTLANYYWFISKGNP